MNDSPKQATPPAVLEEYIMNPNVPKSEAEWWARDRIIKLENKLQALRDELREVAERHT